MCVRAPPPLSRASQRKRKPTVLTDRTALHCMVKVLAVVWAAPPTPTPKPARPGIWAAGGHWRWIIVERQKRGRANQAGERSRGPAAARPLQLWFKSYHRKPARSPLNQHSQTRDLQHRWPTHTTPLLCARQTRHRHHTTPHPHSRPRRRPRARQLCSAPPGGRPRQSHWHRGTTTTRGRRSREISARSLQTDRRLCKRRGRRLEFVVGGEPEGLGLTSAWCLEGIHDDGVGGPGLARCSMHARRVPVDDLCRLMPPVRRRSGPLV